MDKDIKIKVSENITLITYKDIDYDMGAFYKIINNISGSGVDINMISVTPPQGSKVNLSFTVRDEDLGALLGVNSGIKATISSGNAQINLYSKDMENTPGIASRLFKAISGADYDIRIITTSEVQISVLTTAATFESTYSAIVNEFN